jgi:hypothetical protein
VVSFKGNFLTIKIGGIRGEKVTGNGYQIRGKDPEEQRLTDDSRGYDVLGSDIIGLHGEANSSLDHTGSLGIGKTVLGKALYICPRTAAGSRPHKTCVVRKLEVDLPRDDEFKP